MPRGIDEGDLASAGVEPPAIGPAAGYDQACLARDLGIEPGDRALPRVSAYADAFTGQSGRKGGPGPAVTGPGDAVRAGRADQPHLAEPARLADCSL